MTSASGLTKCGSSKIFEKGKAGYEALANRVVRLEDGDVKLMILNRAPLYNKNGVIGYFDYSACIYPIGKVEEQVYFFNHENIAEIYLKATAMKKRSFFRNDIARKWRKLLIHISKLIASKPKRENNLKFECVMD